VGPRAGLDAGVKSRPPQDLIPGSSSPYRVAIPTELSRPILWYWYPKESEHSGDIGVDKASLIFKLNLEKCHVNTWVGSIWHKVW
jgi:hypothetical protein